MLSRWAGGKSAALGEALTISNPATPAATRLSRLAQSARSYSGSEATARAPYSGLAVPEQGQDTADPVVVQGAIDVGRVAQQDDVGLPGRDLDAGAEAGQGIRRGIGPPPGGRVVVGHEEGVEPRATMPAAVGGDIVAPHQGPLHVVADVGVAVQIHYDLRRDRRPGAPASGGARSGRRIRRPRRGRRRRRGRRGCAADVAESLTLPLPPAPRPPEHEASAMPQRNPLSRAMPSRVIPSQVVNSGARAT